MASPANDPQPLAMPGQDAGLPEAAMRRLAELGDRTGALFTSDLSVNEFLLVKEAGFHPLGLVLGSSIYHVGLQVGRWGRNQELTTLTQALYHARELAMSRMVPEAAALGADGIVGVRLDVEQKEFGADVTEFITGPHPRDPTALLTTTPTPTTRTRRSRQTGRTVLPSGRLPGAATRSSPIRQRDHDQRWIRA